MYLFFKSEIWRREKKNWRQQMKSIGNRTKKWKLKLRKRTIGLRVMRFFLIDSLNVFYLGKMLKKICFFSFPLSQVLMVMKQKSVSLSRALSAHFGEAINFPAFYCRYASGRDGLSRIFRSRNFNFVFE